jgi:hypothetical protein
VTVYEDPNREAVGLAPIWTGADDVTEPKDEADSPSKDDSDGESEYDPAEHTVAEVEEYVDANPDQAQAVLDAEVAGKNRSTLVDWLTGGST